MLSIYDKSCDYNRFSENRLKIFWLNSLRSQIYTYTHYTSTHTHDSTTVILLFNFKWNQKDDDDDVISVECVEIFVLHLSMFCFFFLFLYIQLVINQCGFPVICLNCWKCCDFWFSWNWHIIHFRFDLKIFTQIFNSFKTNKKKNVFFSIVFCCNFKLLSNFVYCLDLLDMWFLVEF